MELSKETIEKLKNFNAINPAVLIAAGSEMNSISIAETVMVYTEVVEKFPVEVRIYDIQMFLGTLGLFDEPILDFDESDKYVVVHEKSDASNKIQFTYASAKIIKSPKNRITLPTEDVTFELTEESLVSLQKASTVLGAEDLVVTNGEKGKINLIVTDSRNDDANRYILSVAGKAENEDFKAILKFENLQLLQKDYDVTLSAAGLSQFTSTDIDYWIALHATSEWS